MNEYRCTKEGDIANNTTNIRAIFQRMDEMKNIYDNLSKLTDSVHNLTVNMSVFAEQMKDTKEDLAKIRNDLEYVRNLPMDEYRDIKKIVIGAIIGTIVTTMVAGVLGVI